MGESAEKTEEATPHQIQEARKRGEVSSSRDLSSAVVLTVGFVVLASHAGDISSCLKNVMRLCFTAAVSGDLSNAVLLGALGRACLEALQVLIPTMLAMMVVAFFVPFLQVGALLSLEVLTPKLSRFNPLEGIKRLFFTMRTYIELIKATAKVTVVGWLCWQVISGHFGEILLLSRLPPPEMARLVGELVRALVIRALLFYVGISVLDLFYQRWQYARQQRMTKEEVKKEAKDQEGDPENRAHRKRLHEEIASENMLGNLRKQKPSVIVTKKD
ncbi:MAG: EscU/YscU/HrcU family type III secretion system export apparatus switch protein [Tepidisphaeraceae bacterium]|jgi:flagellar biosynthesis protein FlhB